MIYAYARVSNKDQNADRQLDAFRKLEIHRSNIYLDKESGKDFNRPQYQLLKSRLQKGDLIIIKSIDRLGRNYNDILEEWNDITIKLGVDIKVLDMTLLDTTLHKDLLGNFISNIILQILSYVAEQERTDIKQRQAEGIALAKQKGIHMGRPPATRPSNWDNVSYLFRSKQITLKKALSMLNIKQTTFYKFLREESKNNGKK